MYKESLLYIKLKTVLSILEKDGERRGGTKFIRNRECVSSQVGSHIYSFFRGRRIQGHVGGIRLRTQFLVIVCQLFVADLIAGIFKITTNKSIFFYFDQSQTFFRVMGVIKQIKNDRMSLAIHWIQLTNYFFICLNFKKFSP